MIVDLDRIVEERHQPVSCEVLDGAFVRRDDLAGCGVVLAQDAEDLFGLGGLREGREAA